jgi:hypothetical protein
MVLVKRWDENPHGPLNFFIFSGYLHNSNENNKTVFL